MSEYPNEHLDFTSPSGLTRVSRRRKGVARFANAAAALTTTQKGAIPALPSRQQAEAFLAQQALRGVRPPSAIRSP